MLAIGEQAPDFKLPSTGGQEVELHATARAHRAVVLAFYALDFTPG